jgi:thiaminase
MTERFSETLRLASEPLWTQAVSRDFFQRAVKLELAFFDAAYEQGE